MTDPRRPALAVSVRSYTHLSQVLPLDDRPRGSLGRHFRDGGRRTLQLHPALRRFDTRTGRQGRPGDGGGLPQLKHNTMLQFCQSKASTEAETGQECPSDGGARPQLKHNTVLQFCQLKASTETGQECPSDGGARPQLKHNTVLQFCQSKASRQR